MDAQATVSIKLFADEDKNLKALASNLNFGEKILYRVAIGSLTSLMPASTAHLSHQNQNMSPRALRFNFRSIRKTLSNARLARAIPFSSIVLVVAISIVFINTW